MRLTAHARFGGGPLEKGQLSWHLADGLPSGGSESAVPELEYQEHIGEYR